MFDHAQAPFGDDDDESRLYEAICCQDVAVPFSVPSVAATLIVAVGSYWLLLYPHALQLLVRDPSKRLGAGDRGTERIRRHAFFREIDWTLAEQQRLPPPYIPSTTPRIDTSPSHEPPTLTLPDPATALLLADAPFEQLSFCDAEFARQRSGRRVDEGSDGRRVDEGSDGRRVDEGSDGQRADASPDGRRVDASPDGRRVDEGQARWHEHSPL